MYWLCPVRALEFAKRDLPRVAELGFSGLHYIDVMSVVPPRECYDENHPCTKAETVKYYDEIMEMCHKLFGGFASEGCFDFASKYLDYAFYASWPDAGDIAYDMEIPLWQLVYHGIILSNPSTSTVNYPIKSFKSRLRVVEYGGRPAIYLYSKFMNGGKTDDWLGNEDLLCDTDEQLKYTVSKIKEVYDEFEATKYLQKEFMDKHEVLQNGDVQVTYSDGTKILINSKQQDYQIV